VNPQPVSENLKSTLLTRNVKFIKEKTRRLILFGEEVNYVHWCPGAVWEARTGICSNLCGEWMSDL
jgi:hypothetical protein